MLRMDRWTRFLALLCVWNLADSASDPRILVPLCKDFDRSTVPSFYYAEDGILCQEIHPAGGVGASCVGHGCLNVYDDMCVVRASNFERDVNDNIRCDIRATVRAPTPTPTAGTDATTVRTAVSQGQGEAVLPNLGQITSLILNNNPGGRIPILGHLLGSQGQFFDGGRQPVTVARPGRPTSQQRPVIVDPNSNPVILNSGSSQVQIQQPNRPSVPGTFIVNPNSNQGTQQLQRPVQISPNQPATFIFNPNPNQGTQQLQRPIQFSQNQPSPLIFNPNPNQGTQQLQRPVHINQNQPSPLIFNPNPNQGTQQLQRPIQLSPNQPTTLIFNPNPNQGGQQFQRPAQISSPQARPDKVVPGDTNPGAGGPKQGSSVTSFLPGNLQQITSLLLG